MLLSRVMNDALLLPECWVVYQVPVQVVHDEAEILINLIIMSKGTPLEHLGHLLDSSQLKIVIDIVDFHDSADEVEIIDWRSPVEGQVAEAIVDEAVNVGGEGVVEQVCACQVSWISSCLLYTSPSPRDRQKSRMPSSA